MESHCEDRTREAGEALIQDRYSWPWYVRARSLGLGVRGPLRVTWPLNEDEYALMEARRDLEQVGQILRRLELDRAEIAQLREETRVILARLAA